MALGQIPPWLDVNPQLFTRAIEAGSQAGLGLARIRESSAARAAQDRQQQDMLDQRLAQAAQEADLSRELRREQLSQQLQIEGERNQRLVEASQSGLGLREAQLLLGQQRAESEAGARERGLSLREQALELQRQRDNPDLGEPSAQEIPGAPGVKEVIDSRGRVHIVNPGWMEKLLQGAGAISPAGGTNAEYGVTTHEYVRGKGAVPIGGK